MHQKINQAIKKNTEINLVQKNFASKIKLALVYPNYYEIGMSSLGFQTVYQLFSRYIICERAFLPKFSLTNQYKIPKILTVESNKNISDFDIIAFSVSFENDFINILKILEMAKLPLKSQDRDRNCPLIIAGGVACFLNPEPIAFFIDCFFLGEIENIIEQIVFNLEKAIFEPNKQKSLEYLCRDLKNAYAPEIYINNQNNNYKIERSFAQDLSGFTTNSSIIAQNTSFNESFLIEVSRGCFRGCRFCSAGYVYRPVRFRKPEQIIKSINYGLQYTNKIGLMGASVSDFPNISNMLFKFLEESQKSKLYEKDPKISFSSFRADCFDSKFVFILKQSGVKTVTIAPEAGSERLRQVINKQISEEDIFNACELIVSNKILNIKLYFIIGLPSETFEDIEQLCILCEKIKKNFLNLSKINKQIGTITVSINPFVPKAFTPFQWANINNIELLSKKIKIIQTRLSKIPNIYLNISSPKLACVQAILAQGDKSSSEFLILALKHKENWGKILKLSNFNNISNINSLNNCFDKVFAWDFIDNKINKDFLIREYKKALEI